MDDQDVNALVIFLSNPNRKAENHVATVMEMVQRLAKYEKDLNTKEKENRGLRDEMAMLADPGYDRMGRRRHNEPGYPQMIEIPFNARAVEIKL